MKLFQRLGPNDCRECGKSGLFLIEYENTISELDKTGVIKESYMEGYNVKLVCPHCGKEYYNVGKKGMNFYIKSDLPEVKPVINDYNPFQM